MGHDGLLRIISDEPVSYMMPTVLGASDMGVIGNTVYGFLTYLRKKLDRELDQAHEGHLEANRITPKQIHGSARSYAGIRSMRRTPQLASESGIFLTVDIPNGLLRLNQYGVRMAIQFPFDDLGRLVGFYGFRAEIEEWESAIPKIRTGALQHD